MADPPKVLGISFYINETEIALKMVDIARRAGVKEVWAGNFGAYSPQIASSFDRVITGWGESQVALALNLPPVSATTLVHPEIYGAIGTNLFPKMLLSGLLFTSRGCPWTCTFCQTPGFYGKAAQVRLESIDRVLRVYRDQGITGINILDENFGTFTEHSREVVRLLHRYKMRWIPLTRVDTLLRNFDDWAANGLFGAHLGIESLNQSSLCGAEKKISNSDSVRLLRRMHRLNMFVQAFYILGFEQDTVGSIRDDINTLAQLDLDVVQLQVLTPYPYTQQGKSIERNFGITCRNLSKYNSRNLVWNHPSITPDEMRDLQHWANSKISSSRRALRTLAKFAIFCGQREPNLDGVRLLINAFRGAGSRLHAKHASRIASARRSALAGWTPHEEVADHLSFTGHSVHAWAGDRTDGQVKASRDQANASWAMPEI